MLSNILLSSPNFSFVVTLVLNEYYINSFALAIVKQTCYFRTQFDYRLFHFTNCPTNFNYFLYSIFWIHLIPILLRKSYISGWQSILLKLFNNHFLSTEREIKPRYIVVNIFSSNVNKAFSFNRRRGWRRYRCRRSQPCLSQRWPSNLSGFRSSLPRNCYW